MWIMCKVNRIDMKEKVIEIFILINFIEVYIGYLVRKEYKENKVWYLYF